MKQEGTLVISLDFELYWGVRDRRGKETNLDDITGVHKAIPQILNSFLKYKVHATWATVGILFLSDKKGLLKCVPRMRPNYDKSQLSPYNYLYEEEHLDKKLHFAPDIVQMINGSIGQEVGSHSFSHYYCLEKGQTVSEFRCDMESAIKVAKMKGVDLKSFVFPRNQWSQEYLNVLLEAGFSSFRGNQDHWVYKAEANEKRKYFKRLFRLVDTYINLTGHHCYPRPFANKGQLVDLPASRFLRAWSGRFETLRLKRIKDSMTYAARTGQFFHLWWHPHNFGLNIDENIMFLDRILEHFQLLNKKYGMRSMSMGEVQTSIEKP